MIPEVLVDFRHVDTTDPVCARNQNCGKSNHCVRSTYSFVLNSELLEPSEHGPHCRLETVSLFPMLQQSHLVNRDHTMVTQCRLPAQLRYRNSLMNSSKLNWKGALPHLQRRAREGFWSFTSLQVQSFQPYHTPADSETKNEGWEIRLWLSTAFGITVSPSSSGSWDTTAPSAFSRANVDRRPKKSVDNGGHTGWQAKCSFDKDRNEIHLHLPVTPSKSTAAI
jgi:hypothetical protein